MLLIRTDDSGGQIELADVLPTGCRPRWTATIQLTPEIRLTLVDMRAGRSVVFDAPPPRLYSVHILKSNIQKCVRRRDRQRAIISAWHLLCQDSVELLRRLPVIIAEDALVQPWLFKELVWLMAAVSKGYRLTWMDAATVMAALASALRTTERVAIYAEPPATDTASTNLWRDPLAVALMIRAEFGGMDHDCSFLKRLAIRAATNTLPLDAAAEPDWIEYDIDPLSPHEHILLEAIDQHCCPHVLRELPGLHPQAIWWCRSSLSVRPLVGFGASDAAGTAAAKRTEHTANLEAYLSALDAFSRRQIARGWILPTSAKPTPRPPATTTTKTGPLDAWLKR